MLKDLALFFRNLEGIVTEPVRATIVRRFCKVFEAALAKQGLDAGLESWFARGKRQFVRDCQVTGGFQAVMDDLDVTATQLAHFCDRWLSVTQYRDKDSGEWVPFSSEMNGVRVTMIEELQKLHQEKLDNGE